MCFDPVTNKQHSQYDLFQDVNILPRNNDDEELNIQNRLHDCHSDYRQLVRSLNKKTDRILLPCFTISVKTNDDPLRLFLRGGAGVGKSTVTSALYDI